MKSNLENVSSLERKLNIEVPAAEVQAAFEKAFKGIQKHAAIKGFRKGKAPLNTVKSLFADRVKQDVIQDIIQTHYVSALKEHKLEPISYPSIEFDSVEADKNFQFTAEFEIRPEVTLRSVEDLAVKKEKFTVDEKMVNETLESIQKGQAETAPVLEDRVAQNGDIAIIDFKGFVEGQELPNGSAENHELELGSNTFIPGFEEGIVGMKPGVTATLNLAFPEEYHAKDIAGKSVEFQVTLKELKKKVLPELNDELAKKLGPYETLEDLKKVIREDFEKRESQRINEDLKNRIMKKLVELNPVDVPKTLKADQKKALVEDFEKRMQQQGMNQDQYEEYKQKWDSDFDQTASYMIQASFLVDKLAADQNLRASNADIDTKLKDYASQTGIELKRVQEFYSDEDRRSRLAYQITEEKVLNYLISKAKIEEVSREELAGEDDLNKH